MVLPIFPEGGLTSSVITTVWVGVFVLAFFNLRFGWVLSGLVVPGYVVPLLIVRPIAALVIVVEAVITYLLVYWFSERFAQGRFNALFGRDRFMGLVLASIAVRLTLDGWLLPQVADWLSLHWDLQVDWHSNLQSFGLVVISLMANQLWKPGLARGLFSSAVVIGITWLVVRYGLMEFTNFRLSGVSYVYEGLASSILASPKAYIILVLTAFIASQMNVRYGWDFSGILIPALIALQWYQPAKVLSSFVEAGVIYFLATAVLKLPFFASMTIEGARKLVLFFNVSFVWKLLLGHGLNLLELDVKTTDFYGFGYLLSTLLAIKAYDKDIFPRVMRSTLEVSVAGAAAGNLIGFLFALILPSSESAGAAIGKALPGGGTGLLLAAAAGDAHLRKGGLPGPALQPGEGRMLAEAIELLDSGARPEFVAPGLAESTFRLTAQNDGTLAVARREGGGRDLLLFNPAARSRLAVVVPDAAARPGTAAAGLALFQQQRARWLVLLAPPAPGMNTRDSLLAVLRRSARPPELELVAQAPGAARLVLAGKSAGALDLGGLRELLSGLAVTLDHDGAADRAVLELGDRQLRLLASPAPSTGVPELADCELKVGPVKPVSEPDLPQLAFLRFEVAEPLASGLGHLPAPPEVARRNAELAGWSLDRCLLAGHDQWRLALPGGGAGQFLFAPSGDPTRLVETEGRSAKLLAAGAAIYGSWGAGALLIAPDEERLIGPQRSGFGVISQVMVRASSPAPNRLVQLRPARDDMPSPGGTADMAVVYDVLEPDRSWATQLGALARAAGFRPLLVDRDKATAGLEISANYSIRYFAEGGRGRFATFWLLKQPGGGLAIGGQQ